MRIRIGVKGFGRSSRVVTREDATNSVDIAWVEIDGHRFSEVIDASSVLGYGAHTTSVTFPGAAEVVYLDRFGGELSDGPSPEWVTHVQSELDRLTATAAKRGRHEA